MKSLKKKGWRNVTDLPLISRVDFTDVTQLRNPGLRSQASLKGIFERVISQSFLQVLVDGAKSKDEVESNRERGPGCSFDSEDFMGLVSMILDCCGSKIEDFEQYLYDPNRRVGLSVSKYKKIRKHFSPNLIYLIEEFNTGLKETIEVGGHGALDESMIAWRGDSRFLICIPRKPKSTGLRMYLLSFPLASTGQPAVFHLLPDLREPTYGGRELLDSIRNVLPPGFKISLTADSFFGTLTWLEARKEEFFTLAISKSSDPALVMLLSHNLGHHQYRTFTNGNVVLTLWMDEDLVVTASTRYKVNEPEAGRGEGRYKGVNMSGLTPFLSLESIHHLSQLPHSELQSLARRSGVSSSGTNLEIAYRIGGRLPPPQTTQPGPSTQSANDDENDDEDSEVQKFANSMTQKQLKERCSELKLSLSTFSSPSISMKNHQSSFGQSLESFNRWDKNKARQKDFEG